MKFLFGHTVGFVARAQALASETRFTVWSVHVGFVVGKSYSG